MYLYDAMRCVRDICNPVSTRLSYYWQLEILFHSENLKFFFSKVWLCQSSSVCDWVSPWEVIKIRLSQASEAFSYNSSDSDMDIPTVVLLLCTSLQSSAQFSMTSGIQQTPQPSSGKFVIVYSLETWSLFSLWLISVYSGTYPWC